MQITNVNTRFTTFWSMIKHERHIIDSSAKISENFGEFLKTLVKRFNKKFEDSQFE